MIAARFVRTAATPLAPYSPKEKLSMKTRLTSLMAAAALATVFSHAPALAQSLTGKVSSAAEGAMEGVVISAKKGIVTVSVVSNAKGEFSFPAGKLGAGDYALSIRAAGLRPRGAVDGDHRGRQARLPRPQAHQDQEPPRAALES
jgi:hypothetical protein